MGTGAAAGLIAAAQPLAAATEPSPAGLFAAPTATTAIDPMLLARARAALDYHRGSVAYGDVMGVVDFAKASRDPRFYLVHLGTGMVIAYHVAHGRGSDPDHSGWLERFSNDFGSYASSNGAYVTTDYYHGKYGRSMRLHGLDPSNCNAMERAIVVHSAWYAETPVIDTYGKLGRSEGCFALSEENLYYLLHYLGPGRMIYADKMQAPVAPQIAGPFTPQVASPFTPQAAGPMIPQVTGQFTLPTL